MNDRMSNDGANGFFNQHCARSYDEQRAKMAPIKDALHLCTKMLLKDLPLDAEILCVGAGTGEELISLAESNPQWRFTVVEPAAEMMQRCRQRAEEKGISARCKFHEGFLNSYSGSGAFHAATSILVSHFIQNEAERIKYFTEVVKLIRVGGYLINADLSTNLETAQYNEMLRVWVNMHDYAGMPGKAESFGRNVSLLPAEKIEAMLADAGCENPVLFYQALFIRAWFSRVGAT